jgi:5-methyltetrahydropteroyltriglutamate--homocysteine methyltransferase
LFLDTETEMSPLEERQRRILTTHVGSLPRPPSLSAKLFARMSGQSYDANALDDELHQAVGNIVRTQAELGVDIVSDGELSKTSFQ